MTTEENDKHHKIALSKNPNPKDARVSYIKTQVVTVPNEVLGPKKNDWAFNKDDLPLIRHMKKQYKKQVYKKNK